MNDQQTPAPGTGMFDHPDAPELITVSVPPQPPSRREPLGGGFTIALDAETKALIREALARAPLTQSMVLQLEKTLLPLFEKRIMPKIERRLIELLVAAGVYEPSILDQWDKHHQALSKSATADVGDRALGIATAPDAPPGQPANGAINDIGA